jgi:predicted CXXCH cytochrome family protein
MVEHETNSTCSLQQTSNSMMRILRIWIAVSAAAFLFRPASAGSILESKHNLSLSGPGAVRAAAEDRVCIFCHTPHRARTDTPYLWNRSDTGSRYIPYHSTTLYASVGQPTGASKLCLSCHDGTIAMGAVVSEQQEIPFQGGIRFMPEGQTKLGTDLSDDHPVSFLFDGRSAQEKGGLADPFALPPEVRMDGDGQMQCTACHNPHDDQYGKFLVMSNRYSGLCTACHVKEGWQESAHASSNAPWTGPDSRYSTVAENGCKICHAPHSAGGRERLLRYAFEEDNCLSCHNGGTASTDIARELTRRSGHFVQSDAGIHDAAEDYSSGTIQRHVECADCHNPHRANGGGSAGGAVSGPNTGVRGIDSAGQPILQAQYLYEICYKCHGDENAGSALPVTRQIAQLNVRMEFDPSNPSHHAVAGPGVNPDVPSLLPPYGTNSLLSCLDCHNASGGTGQNGPHGSDFDHLLERNYELRDNLPESAANYALCYKCHNRNSILGNQSFRDHKKHIVDERTSCAVCHDPHGISGSQGSPFNNSHLINFDVAVVQPDRQGRLYFEDLGRFRGQCFLRCHGEEHSPEEYP